MATQSETLIANGQAPLRHMLTVMHGKKQVRAVVAGAIINIYIDGQPHMCCAPAGFHEAWKSAKEHAMLMQVQKES